MTRFTPPTRRYGAYIFDCDGTLADTMPLHHRAWRAALLAAGAQFDFDWKTFTKRAGMSLELTVEELSAEFGIKLDPLLIANEQRKLFKDYEKDVLAIDEVLGFAREVATFAPVSVASGSRRPNVDRTLLQIGALELFPVIVTPEDVVHGKPEPEMFLLAAERMGVRPSDCLVIEDAEFGFEAARRAGMDYAIVSSIDPTLVVVEAAIATAIVDAVEAQTK